MSCKACVANACALVQVMDFGWVQFTEAKILSEYIKTDAYKMEVSRAMRRIVGVVCSVYLTSYRDCMRCELMSDWFMGWRPTPMSVFAACDELPAMSLELRRSGAAIHRCRRGRPWPSPMRCPGGVRVFDIRRTR